MQKSYRWKLVGGKLPLYERHLRSVKASGVSAPLLSWIRSRLEWTFDNGMIENPDGVLCLVWTDEDTVDITDEPARELPDGLDEAGTIWVAFGQTVVPAATPTFATDTLTRDLCKTLGLTVADSYPDAENATERFLISDEFGFVPLDASGKPAEAEGPVSQKLSECFEKLWTLDAES